MTYNVSSGTLNPTIPYYDHAIVSAIGDDHSIASVTNQFVAN